MDESFRSLIKIPSGILGAFGPAVGACYSIGTLYGKQALLDFLKPILSLKFSWKVWASIFAVSGSLNGAAWYIPELFGYERLPMLLPSAFVFPFIWLLMVIALGGQEEIGWRAYILKSIETRFGIWAGNVVFGLIWSAGTSPSSLCRDQIRCTCRLSPSPSG